MTSQCYPTYGTSGRGKRKGPEIKDDENKKNAEELETLMNMFQLEDHFLVHEYIKVVMKHFSWTKPECVKKLLEDKTLIDKFTAWKNKRKIA